MHKIGIFLLVVLFALACSTQKQLSKNNKDRTGRTAIEEDDAKYDVEMFNARFLSWYERYQNPAYYRDQSYYESWNKQYVNMWNSKANSSVGNFPYDPVVGYNPSEDYGFELNHKLFHYFMYVEKVQKIKIMPGGPEFVLLKP